MINENTAYENWCSQSNIHGGYASKRDFVAGWQAAKQSMQGEADPVVLLKVDKSGACKFTMLDAFNEGKYKLYTHAPRLSSTDCRPRSHHTQHGGGDGEDWCGEFKQK